MPRTLGEFHPLGQAGAVGDSNDCYKISPCPGGGFSYRITPGLRDDYGGADSEAYGGDDSIAEDCRKVAKPVADFLDILAKSLNMAGNFIDQKSRLDLQDAFNQGSSRMGDGYRDLSDSGVQFDQSAPDYLDSGFKLNDYAAKLGDLNAMLKSQQSDIKNLDATVQNLENQKPSLDQALRTAEAQQSYAKNPANYPRTPAGLSRQRADQRNASTAVANAKTALVNNERSVADARDLQNSIGAEYNATLQSARQTEAQRASEASRNATALGEMERAQALQNRGYQKVGEGQKTVREGVHKYQSVQDNLVGPIMESATGVRVGANVARSVAQGENAVAVGHAMKGGIEAVARHSGDAGLQRASGLGGSIVLGIAKAVDQNIREGGTFEQGAEMSARAVGQATIRYNDMERIGSAIETAGTIFKNETNPKRVKDGFDLLTQQVGPSVRIGTQIGSTVMSLYPGAEVATPLVNALGEAVATGAQGLTATAVNVVDKIAKGEISAPAGEYPARPIGRCLVDRTSGGQTSAFSTGFFGLLGTGGLMGLSLLNSNEDYALRASALVDSIATTGEGAVQWDPPVTIRPGIVGD